MNIRSSYVASTILRMAVLASVGLALSGCSYLREAAGVNKVSPDEFAVLTKGSLVIPPDFGLLPPKPGAAPTNQADPSGSAQAAIFGADTAAVAAAMPGNASAGEKLLLANAGTANADPDIRLHVTADTQATLAAGESFTNDIMFWQEKKKIDPGKPVDADAEAKRIGGQSQAGQPAGSPPPVKEEDSGWFDGWFDWF